jgi:hypothetical protein
MCNQLFTDDNMFCLNDGTSLLYDSNTAGNPIPFQTSGDMPTQVFNPSQNFQAAPKSDTSKWLFMIIGILGTALIGVVAFVFFVQKNDKKEETAALNSKTANESKERKTPETTQNMQVNTPVKNEKTPPIAQPSVDPSLTPSGSWSGDWASKSATFTASADFTEVNGKVNGRIVWTLQKTSNPKKIDKVGLTATEYVEGVYNPVTRMLTVRGVRKDDPNGIVILDKYNLSLAENNRTLSGKSINGNFVLRR